MEASNHTVMDLESSLETNTSENKRPGVEVTYMSLAGWSWTTVEKFYAVMGFVLLSVMARLLFHRMKLLSSRVPESCLLIIVGVIFGGFLYLVHDCSLHPDCQESKHKIFPEFTPTLFFYKLLPPIILDAAYALHNRVFMNNIRTILLYAVVGTVVNFLLIGGGLILIQDINPTLPDTNHTSTSVGSLLRPSPVQILLWASLISAVDPVAVLAVFGEVGVNSDLYYLVFGESLLNDGVAVVFYDMMMVFVGLENAGVTITVWQVLLGVISFFSVAGGGCTVGLIFGVVTALVTRLTEGVIVLEPLVLYSLAYLSYLTANMFNWSGILSLCVCGVVQAHYSFKNISPSSLSTTKNFIKILSSTSDSIIFLYLGMAMYQRQVWDFWFIPWALVICFVSRFIGTFTLTGLVNCLRRHIKPISVREQMIMAYGGLRGAVGFSLVSMICPDKVPAAPLFVTTTLTVVMCTVFLQGGTIRYLVNFLQIEKECVEVQTVGEEIHTNVIEQVMAGLEAIAGERGQHYAQGVFRHYDELYFKKYLCVPGYQVRMRRLYEEVTLADHMINLYGPSVIVRASNGANQGGQINCGFDDTGDVTSNTSTNKSSNRGDIPIVCVTPPQAPPPILDSVSYLSTLRDHTGEEKEGNPGSGQAPDTGFTAAARKHSRRHSSLGTAPHTGDRTEEARRRWKEAAHSIREKILTDFIIPGSEEREFPLPAHLATLPAVDRAVINMHRNMARRQSATGSGSPSHTVRIESTRRHRTHSLHSVEE